MKTLRENDKLRNVNKELESKGNNIIEEIKRLKMELEATNKRTKIIRKQL